ncbi:MAG: protein kinase [Pirellulaceae bacterium]|nr:protein kinase [Pirellulaceae bacterium]
MRDEFKAAWEAGSAPRLEDFLEEPSGKFPNQFLVDLLKIDVDQRRQLGEHLTAEDYRERFPEHEEVVLQAFRPEKEQLAATVVGAPASAKTESSPRSRQQVGPYTILQVIGEGGMGLVYMADQTEPVRRRVALKVIKAGVATKDVVARFEVERQALALMDHQNIAKVLGAGMTDDGLPYFAMELVQGIAITKFCDRKRLGIHDRLKLFVQVCRAIQHAHQKGVMHRDLKPSNVLVTLHDDVPVAKVIDFGLAKPMQSQARLTDRTLFTEFGQAVGTLEYMSPEQAEMGELGVDTRTDVYSLGVILYELLTGSTPLGRQRVQSVAYHRVLQMIREEEAPRPSTRLHDSRYELSAILKQRQIDPRRLNGILKGELDWIVMKALEKDRTRRYEGAGAFADDVERYLRQDMIEARPPSVGYRLKKTIRKHRAAVVSGSLIFVLLLAGLVGTGTMWWRASLAEAEAIKGAAAARSARESAANQRDAAQAARTAEAQQRQLAEEREREALQQADEARSARESAANQRDAAQAARAAEEQQRQLAEQREQETRKFLYAAQMNIAVDAWQRGDVAVVREILEAHLPSEGQEDLRSFEWHYLWNLSHQEQRTLRGHEHYVLSVAHSLDGKVLASCGFDQTVRLWNALDGEELAQLSSHAAIVRRVAFSPDGKHLVSSDVEGHVKLWDLQQQQELATFQAHQSAVSGLSFSPDGQTLATGGFDSKLKLWDVATLEDQAEPQVIFDGHPFSVLCVTFSSDGTTLVSAGGKTSQPGEILVWDLEKKQRLRTLSGHKDFVASVAISADGRRLASASADQTVRVWDLQTGEVQVTLQHQHFATSVQFSPDDRLLASGSGDRNQPGLAQLWDTATWEEVTTFHGHEEGVRWVDFSPDGQTLATASFDKTVKVWKVPGLSEAGAEGVLLHDRSPAISGIAFSPDGSTFASASQDHRLKLWNAADGQERVVCEGHYQSVRAVAFSPDGKILVSASEDQTVRLWDPQTGSEKRRLNHEYRLYDAAFSPDGEMLVTVGQSREIVIFDTKSWQRRTSWQADNVSLVAKFSPDGKTLATAGVSKAITLWDVETGEIKLSWSAHQSAIRALAFSPDGQQLSSTGGRDGTVILWETATGRRLEQFADQLRQFLTLAFSPNGEYLVAGTSSNGNAAVAVVWSVSHPEEKRLLQSHRFWVTALAFAPDGSRLVAGSDDGTIKTWDTERWQPQHMVAGHAYTYSSLVFSPDGAWLAAASEDFSVQIFAVEGLQKRPLKRLEGHQDVVHGVAFSPDGKWLATCSSDKTVRIWDVGTWQATAIVLEHRLPVRAVAFSPDSRRLATGGGQPAGNGKAEASLWDLPSGELVAQLEGHEWMVRALAFSPDGRWLATASGTVWVNVPGKVRLWDPETGQAREMLEGYRAPIHAVTFSPDSQTLTTGSWDGSVNLRDLTVEARPSVLFPGNAGIGAVGYSADAKSLVTGDKDGVVTLWDVELQQVRAQFQTHRGEVSALAFSPRSDRLASAATYGGLRLWQTASSEEVQEWLQARSKSSQVVSIDGYQPDFQLARVRVKLGRMCAQQDRDDAAETAYLEAIELLRHLTGTAGEVREYGLELAAVSNDLASFYSAHGEPLKAIRVAETAVEFVPANPAYWSVLGAACYRSDQWRRAVETLTQAADLERDNATSRLFLAMAYWQLDDKQQALQTYQAAVQLVKQVAKVPQVLRQLQQEAAVLLGVELHSKTPSPSP